MKNSNSSYSLADSTTPVKPKIFPEGKVDSCVKCHGRLNPGDEYLGGLLRWHYPSCTALSVDDDQILEAEIVFDENPAPEPVTVTVEPEPDDHAPAAAPRASKLYNNHFPTSQNLTNKEYRAFAYLARIHYSTEHVYPSIATIAEQIGTSERSVSKAIAGLQKKGALTVERRFNASSIYKLRLDKKGGYALIPDDMYPDSAIPDGEFRVYVLIASFANRTIPPSHSEMARRGGISRSSVQRSIESLIKKGLVEETERRPGLASR